MSPLPIMLVRSPSHHWATIRTDVATEGTPWSLTRKRL